MFSIPQPDPLVLTLFFLRGSVAPPVLCAIAALALWAGGPRARVAAALALLGAGALWLVALAPVLGLYGPAMVQGAQVARWMGGWPVILGLSALIALRHAGGDARWWGLEAALAAGLAGLGGLWLATQL